MITPTSELVAQEWVKRATGLPNSVAMTLPADNTTWAASGFVTVRVVAGAPLVDVPRRAPIVTCSCWAVNPGSKQLPWGKAADLATRIWAGTQQGNDRCTVTPHAPYGSARVDSVIPGLEPVRVPDDQAGYARFDVDIQIFWIALP